MAKKLRLSKLQVLHEEKIDAVKPDPNAKPESESMLGPLNKKRFKQNKLRKWRSKRHKAAKTTTY